MTLTTTPPPPSPSPTPRPTHPAPPVDGLRLDIEGLRAIAIGTVLIYHAGAAFLPGGFIGVDIFFVISGFLITGVLIREVEKTTRVSLPRFYARRAKRLFPAAALVLAVTSLVTWLTGSEVHWRTFGGDIVSAALYVVNWRLADRSVDYLAEGTGASPVQHFWSLAVEEQFYIVWPLLLLAVARVVRRTGLQLRPLMAVGLSLIALPSLAWSIALTASNAPVAFFVSTTRLWELGIGALIAVGAGLWASLPAAAVRLLGWGGLGAILAAALVFDESFAWPGAWALVPTLGTAAIIIAGSRHRTEVQRLLSLKPAVWLGGLSYSLYLWHWPILIGYQNLFGQPSQTVGLLLILGSVAPAWLSLHLLENPVRFSPALARSTRKTLAVGVALSMVGVLAGGLLMLAVPSSSSTGSAQGAAALTVSDDSVTGIENPATASGITPAPADAVDDVPDAYARDCQAEMADTQPKTCEFGKPDGDRTVVLAGDSKALQWSGVLDAIATDAGWRLLTTTKSSCGLFDATRDEGGSEYTACREHNAHAVDELIELGPDAVIVSQRHHSAIDPETGKNSQAAMVAGLVRVWKRLTDAGIDVVVLNDNPTPVDASGESYQVYECVADHRDDLSACSFSRSAGVAESGTPALLEAARRVPAVQVVDMTDTICNDTTCPPVIGNVLVYRQGSHLTNRYAMSTRAILQRRLEQTITP